MLSLLLTASLFLAPSVHPISIVDFDTCNIPYLVPLSFQETCDRSDEYLSEAAITDLNGKHLTIPSPPSNVTSASIRSKPNLWTHEPFCLESTEANNGFCVYTNSNFANGRGISIVASPREIMRAIESIPFKDANKTLELENSAVGAQKYMQQQIPNKGFGTIANGTFLRGEKLQSYTPILAFQDDMMQFASQRDQELLQHIAVTRLPPASRKSFMDLHGHFGGDPIYDRVNTNAFNARLGSANDYFWAILPETSRFNHDCRPNAVYYFDPETLTHHVHAISTITPGTEITISYLRPLLTHAERTEKILQEWGFQCSCATCRALEPQRQISDYRLGLIQQLEVELDDLSPNRTAGPETAELLVSLYEDEGLWGPVADAYMYAALEYAYIGQKRRAQMWASKAVEGMRIWRGNGHVFFKGLWRLLVMTETHESWMFVRNGYRKLDGGTIGKTSDGKEGVVVSGGGAVYLGDVE